MDSSRYRTAALSLLILLSGLLASASWANGPADPPPPAAEFRNGDVWSGLIVDHPGPIPLYETHILRHGTWEPTEGNPNEDLRFARLFGTQEESNFLPATPTEGLFWPSRDGTLYRYVKGHWSKLPIGSIVEDRNGTGYKVDVRVTPYEAVELTALLSNAPFTASATQGPKSVLLLPSASEIEDFAAAGGPAPAVAKQGTASAFSVISLLFVALGAGLAHVVRTRLQRRNVTVRIARGDR